MNGLLSSYWFKIGFLWAVMGGEALFAYVLPRRRLFWVRIVLSIVALHLICFFLLPEVEALFFSHLYPAVPFYVWLFIYFLVCFFLTLAVLAFCFKAGFVHILFCGVAGYSCESFSYGLQELFSYATGIIISDHVLIRIVFYALTYVAVFFVLSRKLKKNLSYLNNKVTVITSSLILFFVLFIGTIIQENLSDEVAWALPLLRSFFCALSLFILFNIWDRDKKQHELQVLSQIWQKSKQHYAISKDILDSLNLRLHNLKYRALASSGKNELAEAVEEIKLYDADMKTGNSALDVVLTENLFRCQKNNIRLSCMADGSRIGFMEDADIYVLFGNILDNAVEAVFNVSEKEKRNITFTLTAANQLVNIHCENYYEGEIRFSGGVPVTSKAEKSMHGYGTKSICMIAEKYGGYVNMRTEGELFVLDLLLPQATE